MANVVNDGDVRIFPYLGDTYLGVEKTGYSNKKSAMKFMKTYGVLSPDFVYDHFGGKEKYVREHSVFESKETIEQPWPRNPKPAWKKRGTELSDEEYNVVYDLYQKYCNVHKYPNEYGDEMEKLGYDPTGVYISNSEYLEFEEKYIKKHVEYRKGIIHLSVEFTGKLEK